MSVLAPTCSLRFGGAALAVRLEADLNGDFAEAPVFAAAHDCLLEDGERVRHVTTFFLEAVDEVRQVSVYGHASSVALLVISCDARSLDLRVTVIVQLVAEAKVRVFVVGVNEDKLEFAGHCLETQVGGKLRQSSGLKRKDILV